jgi:hypothetical protein
MSSRPALCKHTQERSLDVARGASTHQRINASMYQRINVQPHHLFRFTIYSFCGDTGILRPDRITQVVS